MFVRPDTVTPVVRLYLLLAYWLDIYFGQLTEMALIFSFFANLIWTMSEIWPKKKKKPGRQRLATAATFLQSCVAQALSRADGSATRYALRRNTASIMNI